MNRRTPAVVGLAGLALLSSTCGSDSATVATPTVSAVTVSSTGSQVLLGKTLQMHASSTLTDGNRQSAVCSWKSDNTRVATIGAATGLVTGVASGEATVFCDAAGQGGAKKLRTLPNYAGTWSGTYTVASCSQSGTVALADLCGHPAPVGTSLPYRFVFTQHGDVVAGTFFLGSIHADHVSTTIPIAGNITLMSRIVSGTTTVDVTWQISIPRPDVIAASVAQVWSAAGVSGEVNINESVAAKGGRTFFRP